MAAPAAAGTRIPWAPTIRAWQQHLPDRRPRVAGLGPALDMSGDIRGASGALTWACVVRLRPRSRLAGRTGRW
jgi:hypothetical protein